MTKKWREKKIIQPPTNTTPKNNPQPYVRVPIIFTPLPTPRPTKSAETRPKPMAGEEPATAVVVDTDKKRKAESAPPDGYVCRLCSTPGHWIQVCPTKKTGAKRQRKSDHVPVPGQDPSPDDIERAKLLQKISPPNCKSFGLCRDLAPDDPR